MEKPTKILSEEHQNILKIIGSLNKECGELESKREINKVFFEKVIDFIRNYADKFHHAKEEGILFVELKKDSVELHCDPIEQMLYEHDLGRNFVKRMEEGINENNKEKIIENARGYCRLLQDHISKEDNILYPMADEVLTNEVHKEMMEKFQKAETEKFSQGTKEKYLSLTEELKK
jgi:hemerythrin-like domain-containing protein